MVLIRMYTVSCNRYPVSRLENVEWENPILRLFWKIFIHVSRSETLLIDESDSVFGRDKRFSTHPIRIENKIKKVTPNKLPAIQTPLLLKNDMSVRFLENPKKNYFYAAVGRIREVSGLDLGLNFNVCYILTSFCYFAYPVFQHCV